VRGQPARALQRRRDLALPERLAQRREGELQLTLDDSVHAQSPRAGIDLRHRAVRPHVERVRGGHRALGERGEPGLGVERLHFVHDHVRALSVATHGEKRTSRKQIRGGWIRCRLDNQATWGAAWERPWNKGSVRVNTRTIAVIALIIAVIVLLLLILSMRELSAAIFLTPFAGNWPRLGVPGPLSPDRLLFVAAIAVVLLRAPPVADRPCLRITGTHWLLALAAAYAVVSALLAGTFFQRDGFIRIFDAFGILPFLTFLVAAVVFRTPAQRRVLLATLVVLGAYLGPPSSSRCSSSTRSCSRSTSWIRATGCIRAGVAVRLSIRSRAG
jgi:hypothetical protein